MEKIISINLGGRIIAIEDAAYNSLKAYFESLRNYFANEESRDEIINDIESRVSELMDGRLKKGASAITQEDVEEIINSIGRVEDFAAQEEAPQPASQEQAHSNAKTDRRFYRDSNDKILGGVCSGLAAYMNIDPALVRIVFAILTLGGWGFGVLLYLLLWIFVPNRPLEGYRGRRLFRNMEDKWLGGVASGIGAYLGQPAWIMRIVFISPILLSMFSGGHWWLFGSFFFGSLTGTFLLIYIVLWVVLPPARSSFEKMEMRGEKVDLNSIRQGVASSDLKARVRHWKDEASDSAKTFMNTRGKAFGKEVSEAVGVAGSRSGPVIGRILHAVFTTIGIAIAFALFITLMIYAFGGIADLVNGYLLQTPRMRFLGWCTVLLLLGIPLIEIVIRLVRRSMNMKRGSRILGTIFLLLWLSGFVCAFMLADDIKDQFMLSNTTTAQELSIQPRGETLTVAVPDAPVTYGNSLPWLHGNIEGWDVTNDSMKIAYVNIRTGLSPDSLYHVQVVQESRGSSMADARKRATQMKYHVEIFPGTDSILALANGYTITPAEGFRAQRVTVTIQVPAGKKIRFDESVDEKLFGITSYPAATTERIQFGKWSVRWDDNYESVDWESNVSYIMSADGHLVNAQAPTDTLKATRHSVHRRYGPGTWRYEMREEYGTDADASRKADSLDMEIDRLEAQKEVLENDD